MKEEIVTEDIMHVVFEYMAKEPHPEALAVKALSDAEHELERVYAVAYAEQTGTVKNREMACDRDPGVGAAKAAVSKAKGALAEHRRRIDKCHMAKDIWDRQYFIRRDAERAVK